MADTLTEALKHLASPARNRYFYGKLLDVYHFEMEQQYHNRKRWLLNRLGLGAGVLCGLEVRLTDAGEVMVSPGVAIDPYGREIIVPQGYCIENPRQPTNASGQPDGDPLAEGTITICLAYHECDTEPVPVLVGDCDTQEQCAPSVVRERFRIMLRSGTPDDLPGLIAAEECAVIFPPSPPDPDEDEDDPFNRRAAAGETLSEACPTPDTECVILGTIILSPNDEQPITLDPWTYRTTTYSNAMLFDLLLCLAERVDRCCRTLSLRYVSGDAQNGDPGAELEPLIVEVLDADGNPVPEVEVRFQVRGGGGSVEPESRLTNENGRARTRATLGPEPGLNTYEAALADDSAHGTQHVLFMALARGESGPGPVTRLPVILNIWPENAARMANFGDRDAIALLRDWSQQPRIAIGFDREMNTDRLRRPERWLRVFQVFDMGEIVLNRVNLDLTDVDTTDARSIATYAFGELERNESSRFLVLIRAIDRTIIDQSDPPLLLDAEFGGTAIPNRRLAEIWERSEQEEQIVYGIDPERSEVWDGFTDTGATLPQSGDGAEGGVFHSWFELDIRQVG